MSDEPEIPEENEPDSFLEAVAAMDESELPPSILFYPVIAQDLIAAHLEGCFDASGSPWSFLEVARGGDFNRSPTNHVSVVAAQAQIPGETKARGFRLVPVTVGFHTSRDVPLDIAARLFSQIQVALQPQAVMAEMAELIAEAEYAVRVTAIVENGESQSVAPEEGRIFSKTIALAIAHQETVPT